MSGRARRVGTALIIVLLYGTSCTQAPAPGSRPTTSTPEPSAQASPIDSRVPVVLGAPIDTSTLGGRIVLSTEDDIYTASANGTGLVQVTHEPGPEFDPSWSPDGERIVYRDSRRGINQDDEIYVMNADGTGRRDITDELPPLRGAPWLMIGRFRSRSWSIPLWAAAGWRAVVDGDDLDPRTNRHLGAVSRRPIKPTPSAFIPPRSVPTWSRGSSLRASLRQAPGSS